MFIIRMADVARLTRGKRAVLGLNAEWIMEIFCFSGRPVATRSIWLKTCAGGGGFDGVPLLLSISLY
jgi:hypothetical protein